MPSDSSYKNEKSIDIESVSTESNTPTKVDESKSNLPTRSAIQIVSILSQETVTSIDKDMNQFTAKAPLLMFVLGSGILSSMSTSFIKGVSEQVAGGNLMGCLKSPGLYILLVLVGLCLVFQLHFMNLALKYYDQLEIIPIY
jgi:hypothetical protein